VHEIPARRELLVQFACHSVTVAYHAAHFRMSASHTNPMVASVGYHSSTELESDVSRGQDVVHNHPPPRLSSRHPIWSDLPPVDMNTQWKDDWQ